MGLYCFNKGCAAVPHYHKPRRTKNTLSKTELKPLFVVKVVKPFRHYMQTMKPGDYTVIAECDCPGGKWYRLKPEGLEGLTETGAQIVWIDSAVTDRPYSEKPNAASPAVVATPTRLYTRK